MNFIFMAASNTILDASKNAGIGQFLLAVLSFICLAIDSVVYFAITVAYKLFLALAQFEIFNNEAFDFLINRTYIIIGVVSLFVVAYSLLNSIINPDNAGKGNKSFAKIVKNVVIAIVGVAIVPTIFNYFYYFQRVVLCNNFIPRLILQQVNTDTSTLENIATELPELIFESFFYPNGLVADGNSNDNNFTDDLITSEASKIIIGHSNPVYDTDTYSLADAYTNAKNGYSFWTSFEPFIFSSPGVSDNSIQYLIILSTVAGGYIAYVFLNLCLDMGLRAVKLGYLELIAPLAIMTSIVPGQDGVFKNWSKKTISCAVEVFTRLFVVVFAVYLVGTVKNLLQPSFGSTICGLALNKVYILLLRAIIYCAIFTFAKQAPKFFSEATGIKSDGFKIGLLDKMKENGMIQAFGAAGGLAGASANYAAGGIRNIGRGFKAVKNAVDYGKQNHSIKAGLKQGFGSARRGIVTFASGVADMPRIAKAGYYGYKNTENAKSIEELKSGVSSSIEQAMNEEGIISKAKGVVSSDWQGIKDVVTTEYGGANRFDSKKELKKATEMDNIKSIIDSMKSASDAINATKIKNLEQLHQIEVSQIQEQYKKSMDAASSIADGAERERIEREAYKTARTAIERSQNSLDFEKRNLQTSTFQKNDNAQIVEYRKKLANAVRDNYELVKEAMSIANAKPEYVERAADKSMFIKNILDGTAFEDVEINGENKKSVILELGTDLGTASTQKKTAAVNQPKKKDTK